MSNDPKVAKQITIRGRLSYPTFENQLAFEKQQKFSKFAVSDPAKVSGDFQLLLDQAQWDKFLKHAVEVFLPYCAEQYKKGVDENDALDPKHVGQLIKTIEGDLDMQTLNTPAKPVSQTSLDVVPDAVAAVKAIGPKGADIKQFAVVYAESELAVPDPDILAFPVLKPIHETTHELYAGCVATATLSLYSYLNGKNPGFSARATACVFKGDADRFGSGGSDIDIDEVLMG